MKDVRNVSQSFYLFFPSLLCVIDAKLQVWKENTDGANSRSQRPNQIHYEPDQ